MDSRPVPVHPIEEWWRRAKLAIPILDRLNLIYAVHCCISDVAGPVVYLGDNT